MLMIGEQVSPKPESVELETLVLFLTLSEFQYITKLMHQDNTVVQHYIQAIFRMFQRNPNLLRICFIIVQKQDSECLLSAITMGTRCKVARVDAFGN